MPRKIGPRAGKKRTKTFSGCWTCRARGVKCDTLQPACLRCQKAKRVCEGYGIRLSWVADQTESETGPIKGRLLFSESDMIHPTFTEEEIESALGLLDSTESIQDASTCQAGPFAVFNPKVSSVDGIGSCSTDESRSTSLPSSPESTSQASYTFSQVCDDDCWQIFDNLCDDFTLDDTSNDTSITTVPFSDLWTDDEVHQTSLNTKEKLFPLLQPFLSSSSRQERELFHFWVTSVSCLMIATGDPDNPFQRVIIPLAMAAAEPWEHNPINKALLHSVYALTSFNIGMLHETQERHVAAIRHQEFSLRLLRSSLSEDMARHRTAFLATIVILSTIEAITGQYSEWRIHVEAGRGWLQSLEESWQMTEDETVMYQLFRLLEGLGNTYRPKSLKNLITEADEEHADTHNQLLPLRPSAMDLADNGCTYHNERLFGLTKPVFDMIVEVNRRASSPYPATSHELRALERKILLINPATQRFPSATEDIERLTRHHACAFHIACNIYYERSLLGKCSKDLQHLVEQGLYHLTAINKLEGERNISGLLWPVYVIACEAESKHLRDESLFLFEKRHRQGIGGAANVQAMVLEVWHRRDIQYSVEVDMQNCSFGILEHLGIDLLLV